MQFTATARAKAPVETVWEVLIDVENWHTWTPTVTRVKPLRGSHGPIAVGSRYRIRQPSLAEARWQVTEFEPNERFTWVNSRAGVRMVVEHRLTRAGSATVIETTLNITGALSKFTAFVAGKRLNHYIEVETNSLRKAAQDRARS